MNSAIVIFSASLAWAGLWFWILAGLPKEKDNRP